MRFVVGAVVLAGCYAPSVTAGGPCSDAGYCPAGLQCVAGVCVAEPALADAPIDDAPPDVAIDACADLACTGATLVACGVSTPCDFGCLTTGAPHCARITPSNGLTWDLVPSPAGALVLSGNVTLDTSAGTLTQGGTPILLPPGVAITNAGGMRVLAVGDLAFQATATLTVVGGVPLAILVDGDATLPTGAVLSLAAGCPGAVFDPSCGGPGGGTGGAVTPATGCGPGQRGGQNVISGSFEVGGGGGGHGFDGAFSNDTAPGRGRFGDACGGAMLEPLTGGGGGGGGGIDAIAATPRLGGRGGGGGGAIQITVAGTFTLAGAIDAAGAGGENGRWSGGALNNGGGGGGGAGGGILVEAGVMTGTGGLLTANGGGGGGNVGAPAVGQLVNGENGRANTSCANGGEADGNAQPGGRGGCRINPPNNGNGGAGLNGSGDRGGGGGAAGRIRINARTNTLNNLTSSPSDTRGTRPLQ